MQINQDSIHVVFACKCMTHDESGWKCWKNGEYNKLDPKTLDNKLQQHILHCPYKGTSNEIKAWTKEMQELQTY